MIVDPKSHPVKDAQVENKMGKKNGPTDYKSANIFYSTALEPSEIDFPGQSTSEMDLSPLILM